MHPSDVLMSLRMDGLALRVSGSGTLLASPTTRVTEAHRTLVAAYRAELVALLTHPNRVSDLQDLCACGVLYVDAFGRGMCGACAERSQQPEGGGHDV
jgi:hypothetical protein